MPTYKQMQKTKLLALTHAITSALENISIDDMIVELYIKSDNPHTWELIKKFEGAILDCKLNPSLSVKNIQDFLIHTTQFIKENNLYREFLDFYYLVYTNCYSKKINPYLLSAYISIIIEQMNCLCGDKEIIIGLRTDGSLMTMTEPYPNIEYATLDFYEKVQSGKGGNNQLKILQDSFKKYGYTLKTSEEFNNLTHNEVAISNEFHSLMPIIDEDYEDMLPIPYFEPFSNFIYPIRQWFETEKYKEHLKVRKYMLPRKGVVCIFKNAGNIQEITFREKCLEEKIIMIYKAKMQDGKNISGFYDPELQFFSDVWKGSGDWKQTGYPNRISSQMENFILEVYAHLATGMEVTRKKNSAILIVNDINNPGFFFDNQPVMQVLKISSAKPGDTTKEVIRKPFNKADYIEVTKFFKPFIRKLPQGSKASDEAKAFAHSMGYELQEGETFVKSFHKNIHIKKD